MLRDVTRRRLPLRAGVEIALLDWGGGGPLALLHHANGFCAAMWAPVAERLRDHFRVVAMDARGHGDSSKPRGPEHYAWARFAEDCGEVAATLAAEHGGEVALGLGHSFGGTSILVAAAQRPGLFARIVALDPVLLPPPGSALDPQRGERSNELVTRARKRRRVFDDRASARAFFAEKDLFRGSDPRALDLYVAEALADRPGGGVELKCPAEVEGAVFSRAGETDVWSIAPQVQTPTLVLWAKRGNFPRPAYEAFFGRMPHAVIHDVDTGHLVPMEQPDLVVDEVIAFAGGAAAPQRSSG